MPNLFETMMGTDCSVTIIEGVDNGEITRDKEETIEGKITSFQRVDEGSASFGVTCWFGEDRMNYKQVHVTLPCCCNSELPLTKFEKETLEDLLYRYTQEEGYDEGVEEAIEAARNQQEYREEMEFLCDEDEEAWNAAEVEERNNTILKQGEEGHIFTTPRRTQ